jgi:hypothetical protein
MSAAAWLPEAGISRSKEVYKPLVGFLAARLIL